MDVAYRTNHGRDLRWSDSLRSADDRRFSSRRMEKEGENGVGHVRILFLEGKGEIGFPIQDVLKL